MKVTGVEPGGEAERAGIMDGDELVAIDGKRLEDAIDLTFTLAWSEGPDSEFEIVRGGRLFRVTLPSAGPGELGLEVEEAPTKTCGNACIFCFVDQLPRALRPSLYVKDEDYRLSFSYGNYITLTNLSDADYERIADQRLSPLYVSVHATDDAVRREMLGSDDAPAIIPSLRRLGDAGVRIHAQAVLCPGVNDGPVLERTLRDLFGLGEMIQSVAIVPVGLTKHRSGLPLLEGPTAETAGEILDTVARWQKRYLAADRERTVHVADELYLRAGRALPKYDDYDGFPQLENGIGLLRSFQYDLAERAGELGGRLDPPLKVTLVTGRLAENFMRSSVDEALGRVDGLTVRVVGSDNELLGPSVTVAGLLSGADLAGALRDAPEADTFLVPDVAFNEDGVTLDGMNLSEIAAASGRKNVVATDDIVGAITELTRRKSSRDATADGSR